MSGSITSLGWIDFGPPVWGNQSIATSASYQDALSLMVTIQSGQILSFTTFDTRTMKWMSNFQTWNLNGSTWQYLHPPVHIIAPYGSANASNDYLAIPLSNGSSSAQPPLIGAYDGSGKLYTIPIAAGLQVYGDFAYQNGQCSFLNLDQTIDIGYGGYVFFFGETPLGDGFLLGWSPYGNRCDVAFQCPGAGGGPGSAVNSSIGANMSILAPPGFWLGSSPNTFTSQYGTFIPNPSTKVITPIKLSNGCTAPGSKIISDAIGIYYPGYLNIEGYLSSFYANGYAYYTGSPAGRGNYNWQGAWIGSTVTGVPYIELYYYKQGFALPLLVLPPTTNPGTLYVLGPGDALPMWLDASTGHLYGLDFTLRQFSLHNTINLSRNRGQ